MKTLNLHFFNNPTLTTEVGRPLLVALFAPFHKNLGIFDIYLPNPDSETPHYFRQLADTLNSEQNWPDTFEQTLLAIEQMASPQMQERRQSLITHAGLAPASSPLSLAIQLWLRCPYPLQQLETTSSDTLSSTLSSPHSPTAASEPSSSTIHDPSLPPPKQSVGGSEAGLAAPKQSEGGSTPNSALRTPNCFAILPSVKVDSDSFLAQYFMPHQIAWILGEEELHAQKKPAFALAEKSVRIGWTFCDAFKNVRKRLQFPNRDYLFVTKDYQSGLEYMLLVQDFARLLNFTRAVVAHGEDYVKVPRLDSEGRPTAFTEEVKVSYIKFDNKSRIIAFSANPQAMTVYGGDVGLDEFAKHPNAQLLWQTAQARVTWGYDMAVWSSHQGEDTLFNQFAQQARAGKPPWNLYYRVTIVDALKLGLLDVINRTRDTDLTPEQFIADCKARAGLPEIYEQTYMCNPVPGAAGIVDWSAIERCRSDYQIERVHLEASDVLRLFGEFSPSNEAAREAKIAEFLRKSFASLFAPKQSEGGPASSIAHRLGFDVAASGEGDLATFYIDEPRGSELWLRALLTVRTEDWHFLKTVLFYFLQHLRNLQAAGDASGLGRQICWEAAKKFSNRFVSFNLASKKHDLGFSLMNQLSVAEKRFPKSELDIAADYLALRKSYTGAKWIFSESRNPCNPASHCDIAWAGALATEAHNHRPPSVGAAVVYEHGTVVHDGTNKQDPNFARMLLSDDPSIWSRLC